MAAKKTAGTDSAATIQLQRLRTLSVRNFRCIGPDPVKIELDRIVVLVGPNNVGKSSLLRAYEVVMSEGSKEGSLAQEDFPNGTVDPSQLPEIELETILGTDKPGPNWIGKTDTGEEFVRERWRWTEVGKPDRQGYDFQVDQWSEEEVPWGAPNIAQAGRPRPHRVDAFANPAEQAQKLVELLTEVITERASAFKKTDDAGGGSEYEELRKRVAEAQKKIVADSKEQIKKVEEELSKYVEDIFPNYQIQFDARPEEDLDKCISFFEADAKLRMGPAGGHLSPVELQGSGARRTLLWSALRILANTAKPAKKAKDVAKAADLSLRSNMLLIDEPEICLHPNAIREACRVLYDLPESGHWQVMATTHSPAFIDVTRDNTTIVRVSRELSGKVTGTTIFRPDTAKLDEDDKKRLKLLNAFDPYVAEFFFGGHSIIVEGDTEYTAFHHVIASEPETFRDIHVIRARGKATIVSVQKILNQFGAPYAVLHDSDGPLRADGSKNGAWTTNQQILDTSKASKAKVRVVASIGTFEKAYLAEEVAKDKPYHALEALKTDSQAFGRIRQLLLALCKSEEALPPGAIEWGSLTELEAALPIAPAVEEVEA